MNSLELFDWIGILSSGLSMPIRYWIIYLYLKKILVFKYTSRVYVIAASAMIVIQYFIAESLVLTPGLKLITSNLLWIMAICLMFRGGILEKTYATIVQASVALFTAITFTNIDYKTASMLLDKLDMSNILHICLLFIIDVFREFIDIAVMYIFYKYLCKLLSFREKPVNKYQSIYLLLPCAASYGIAVIFYLTQQVRINHRNYYLMSIFPDVYYVVPVIGVSLMLALLATAYTFKKMLQGEENRQRNLLMIQQFNDQIHHGKSIESLYAEIRGTVHDLRNHLICLRRLAEENNTEEIKKYIGNLDTVVSKLNSGIKTGNAVSDAVINEKCQYATAQGIEFRHDFSVPTESTLEPADLCVILSNALDNSIEACMRIKDASIIKAVSIQSKYRNPFLIIEISNSTDSKLQYMDNRIVSQKANSSNHGIGLSNIVSTINKYNGVVDIMEENQKFTLNLMLRINETPKGG